MIPVTFRAQRYEAMGTFGDVSLLEHPAVVEQVISVTTIIINDQIDPLYGNPDGSLLGYLQERTHFASRLDEYLSDLWFNNGIVNTTHRDLTAAHELVCAAARMLALDVAHLMKHVLNHNFKIHKLTLNNSVGELWLF